MTITIHFVTGNRHKLEEVVGMVGPGFKIRQLKPRAQEIRSDDLEEIARQKAFSAGKQGGKIVMAEDAGLFVKALFGFPGTYSAYVHEKVGCDGILKLMERKGDRRAEFRSAIALLPPDGKARVFTGTVEGTIAKKKLGKGGFAFDKIFTPRGHKRSFGQMDTWEKNAISHRGRAFRKVLEFLQRKRF